MKIDFKQKSPLLELLIIMMAAVMGMVLAHYYDLFEVIYRYSRAYEEYEIDEIIIIFIIITIGLAFFSLRRWREQVREHAELRRLIDEKESVTVQLRDSFEKIRILKGFLPICSHCKKIRDDEGSWQQLEKYITEHSEAKFSHGICPICLRKYYSSDLSKNGSL